MREYPKINAPFKRDGKGKLIHNDWCMPELEFLAENEWEFTEKVDGTNIRVQLTNLEGENVSAAYAGRTDRAQIPGPLLTHLEAVFPTYFQWRRDLHAPSGVQRNDELTEWMNEADLDVVTLYGEGYGPGIQGGGKYREDQSFV